MESYNRISRLPQSPKNTNNTKQEKQKTAETHKNPGTMTKSICLYIRKNSLKRQNWDKIIKRIAIQKTKEARQGTSPEKRREKKKKDDFDRNPPLIEAIR